MSSHCQYKWTKLLIATANSKNYVQDFKKNMHMIFAIGKIKTKGRRNDENKIL